MQFNLCRGVGVFQMDQDMLSKFLVNKFESLSEQSSRAEAQGDSATSKFNSLLIKVSAAPVIVIQTTCSEVVFHSYKRL